MKKYLHILICSFITILSLSAQNVGLHTTTPLAKLHVDLGDNHANGILFTGLDPTGGTFPSLGAGRRFMFYPGKGALRAGVVEGAHWDNSLVGNNSVAFGFNSIARAPLTFALGDETRARGFISSAFGSNTIAKGYSSMVMGMFNDSLVTADQDAPIPGTPLFIIGNGDDNATRNNAMVVYKNGNMILQNPEPFYFTKLPVNYPIPVEGEGTRMMWLPEIGAFRVGSAIDSAWNANKIGPGSFATGANATASGVFSFAAGLDTKASSGLSTVFGYGNQTKGYSSTAIGMFNDPILTAVEDETAAPGSPLFMIGNGDDYDERHNALVVFKNGNLLMKNPQPYYVTGVPAEFEMPVEGAGTRMMWIPEMSAFRAGTVGGNDWDEAQLGIASFAGGQNTVARGFATTAFGNNNSASGDNATALGIGNITNGFGALTVGLYNNPIIGLPQDEIDFITPLFIIGNGNNLADRKNAMVVRKDGHVGIGTNTPITTLHVDVDYNLSDGFIFEGEFTPGALNPNLGAGTRMLFFPGKGSFRAGSVSGTQWNNSNTGDYSVAMGQNTTASGVSAAAFGEGTFATGENSFSYGEGNHAIGENSLSFGYYNAAVAINSTAGGAQSRARGYGSTVTGWYNIAKGFASTVVGIFNDSLLTTNQTSSFSDLTPLFIVGNGDSEGSLRNNALTVYKNGITTLVKRGTVTVEPITYSFPVYLTTSGTKLLWVPEKSAFRVGTTTADNLWSGINLGTWSFASGFNTIARGIKSTAFGANTSAFGEASTALGGFTTSRGDNSLSMGYNAYSNSYAQITGGRFNDTLAQTNPNLLAWESNDALFVLGNGTGSTPAQRHNALVVFKNGNTDISGFTRLGDSTATNVPRIKMKKLTGTSSASQNTWVNIPHGLTQSKIISVNIIMTVPGLANLPPSYTFQAGHEYHYQVSTTTIVVINSATNSFNILSKNFTILLVYEE